MQVYFFGWGFFALGHDNTLERKLTGQLTESRARPNVVREVSRHSSESSGALPQQDEQRDRRIEAMPTSPQERAAAGDERGLTIDIESCAGATSQATGTANNDERCGVDGEHSWAELSKRMLCLFLSPNIIAVTMGVVIAMIPPLQRMLFANSRAILRPLGATLEVRCVLRSA